MCALARYSSSTLWKRIDAGVMPAPIDRGGRGFLFDRQAVRAALGLDRAYDPPPEKPGTSIPKPTVKLSLGRYVVVKGRVGGTARQSL